MLRKFLLILLLLALIFILAYSFQRHLIYFPAREKPVPKDFHAGDMKVINITVEDGLSLNSWYKPPLGKKPVILYLHGNAGHIGHRLFLVRSFLSEGFGVLLLEYRGYGGNPGTPTESGLYQDGRAAVNFLLQQGIKEKNIVLYGESLGTGVATQLATEFPICTLILQSPFTSLTDLARYHYYWLPIPIKDRFDSLSRIQQIHAPVLMLHGQLDEIVPYSQGLALFNHANQPKKWVSLPYKGHNNMWDELYPQIVIDFIHSHCSDSKN